MTRWVVTTDHGEFLDVFAWSELGAVHKVMVACFCRCVVYSVKRQAD